MERTLRNSFLVSADMAHALHPNYSDKHDPDHQPRMHGGLVLKHNNNQRYATNAVSAALFRWGWAGPVCAAVQVGVGGARVRGCVRACMCVCVCWDSTKGKIRRVCICLCVCVCVCRLQYLNRGASQQPRRPVHTHAQAYTVLRVIFSLCSLTHAQGGGTAPRAAGAGVLCAQRHAVRLNHW